MISVGIIGLSFGQDVLAPAFRRDARCRVEAIAGTSLEKARAAAAKLSIPRAYASATELLADPKLDAVAIAVPPLFQGGLAAQALDSGKHVFCEKPLGCGPAAARELALLAAEKNLVGAVDYEFAELESWRKARETIASGRLGALRFLRVDWHMQTYTNRARLESWKTNPEERGGTLHNFLSHVFYYLEWMAGPIEALACRQTPQANQCTQLLLRFSDACVGSVNVSANTPALQRHLVEAVCERGRLVLENTTRDYVGNFRLRIFDESGESAFDDPITGAAASVDGRILAVGRLAGKFLDRIEAKSPRAPAGGEIMPGLASGARVEYLLEAAEISDKRGEWSDVREKN